LGYRIYRDLKRGWRITSPNLEQSGLLRIEYASLEELCAAEDVWQNTHVVLTSATPETRMQIARVLLDYMRRELAIKVTYLDQGSQESLRQLSSQRLIAPWAMDEMRSWSILLSCSPDENWATRMNMAVIFTSHLGVDTDNSYVGTRLPRISRSHLFR